LDGSTLNKSDGYKEELAYLNLAVSLVHAGQIDFGNELDGWWGVRIAITAVDVDAVDAVLMCTLQTSHNSISSSSKEKKGGRA
jgi:hypothetical protein